ncbi:hypothetical protein SEMRO_1015_G231480.1 [Seminavis robusta]|uniref:Uncharacterized protein n=1 Tax=Seminavis robusta TaxID=568900 RepID=A0A9N8HLA6_9STRA|nr:hypothetical protein SEMRO_1015_G231480.1 [Seminavis robusta]|eukprot:Sro1015_g231480.1 n/a (282) ;mRNA; f:2468-3497
MEFVRDLNDFETYGESVLTDVDTVTNESVTGTIESDLEGVVEDGEDNEELVDDDGRVLAAPEKKKRAKLQHICLTLWDTSVIHRAELKQMLKKEKWCGYVEGKEGSRTDRHDLRNAIYEEGVQDLKELRYRFPNQMAAPGGEAYTRKLMNDVTPVHEPERSEREHLWARELRCKLMGANNGREIITVHSMQTRQGKSKMMERLEFEYNQRREGSCLIMTVAPARDMMDTIKDFKHTLELLIIEIPKAKGELAFLKGAFGMMEHIKNGQTFASKFMTEAVRF